MQPKALGWDIGGAHVKVALVEDQKITLVEQLSCPLWKGLDELSECIQAVKNICDVDNCQHAVTMTGELVDYFSDREQGVAAIVNEMSDKLRPSKVKFYAGQHNFINAQQAIADFQKIASVNWLASANYTAGKVSDALFIDIGSTTTDIIPIHEHKVSCAGFTDEERLMAKELVYCGVIRTPIFAICKSALIKHKQVPVINEYFSNTADVYRLTNELTEYSDLSDALDGRPKDIRCSAIRLARMFANDAQQSEVDIWCNVAKQVRAAQVQMIKDAARHQCLKNNISLATPIIGAGIGRFLLKDIAQQLGREYIDFEELLDFTTSSDGFGAGDCAPAAAVAYLASFPAASPESSQMSLQEYSKTSEGRCS